MGIASIWTGLGLRTSGPDHRAPWLTPLSIQDAVRIPKVKLLGIESIGSMGV